MRSSAAESQTLAAQRAREAARARTRENSSEVTSETGDEIPREDFDGAPSSGLVGVPADDGQRWPDEASETVFLAEQVHGGPAPQRAVFTPKKNDEGPSAPITEAPAMLPPLQSLVDRLPAATRETLEDLFRARFVLVKQIQKENLKN